ncbi:serine hydrolase domain-containing protein [Phenylobacterium sp.]|uniref:serine hydrolase domain-containing protein n=1 Tax=Phenylobacterium sp. TaxID=1871053 RepID=UPI002CB45911|nr:serine hydrolase domain-containing protein [Phenylobacterium sp.]HVI34226.1 serine hydrolase domain-containing protein [Phenylobacterium sp.]
MKRSIVKAAVAALALLVAAPAAVAQDPAPAAPAPAVDLPDAPVPYTKIRPQRRPQPKAASRPAPAATAPAAGAASAATTAAPGPAVAGAVPTLARQPTTVTGARLSAGQALPPAELEAFVDGMVKDAMGREHIAGVTVSVVQNGQVVLKKGYGFADLDPRRPVDPDRTLFRLGSISKTFTWIALMKEVEAGRIRLTAPINLYLPEKVRVRDQGYQRDVQVQNLMDHSPGFEDRALGHLFEGDPDRVRPLELYLRQERPRRVAAPGVVSTYSNYGVGLAGQAVTYVSGKPFEQQVEDEIFTPLGMGRTTFREPREAKRGLPGPMPAALAADVSDAYRWTPAGFERRGFEYVGQIAPAGAASSTAADMARYMIALLNGGQLNGVAIYSPRTAQAFRRPLRPTPTGINGWAHGFMIYELPGGYRGFGHGGDTIFFHSNMVTVPALNLGIFISTNTETGAQLAARFPDRLVREFYAAPHTFPRPGSPELVRQAGMFTGHYLTSRRAYSGLEGFVTSLIGGGEVSVTDAGRLVTGSGEGVRTWVPDGPLSQGRFVATDGDQRIAFVMRDGKATGYLPTFGGARMERAPFWRRPPVLAVLAALTAFAAIATLGGIFLRNRREFRENAIQARAALVQNIQAGLWLISMALLAVWATKTGDVSQIIYRWPGALLITASACALVAAALTLTTIIALPAIWRGGRRVDSWTHLRKAFFTVTVLVYAAFSVVLGLWGALSPWSG